MFTKEGKSVKLRVGSKRSCLKEKVMTEKDFEAFLMKCQQEVKIKQSNLTQKYALNTYQTYSFSQANKSLELKKDNGEVLRFEVACIGSWGYEDHSWVWAWNNENLSESIREEANTLKDLAQETGYNVFEQGSFECEEIVAKDLAFVSVYKLKAQGIYRIVADESYLFLALKNVK